MNRTELVEEVSRKAVLDKKKADDVVRVVTETVMSEAKAGNKVSIFGFGTFSPTARAARMGRNPQTGAPVKIAAAKSVRFAPASAFKEVLNSRGKAAASKKAAPARKTTAKKVTAKKAAPAKKATRATKAAKKR